jgi:hypothetical protein
MVFKFKKTEISYEFTIGPGLMFRRSGESSIRTLGKEEKFPEDYGISKGFRDSLGSIWSKQFLNAKFKRGEFIYLGF